MYILMHMYIHVHMYMHMYIHVHMYMHMHIHVHEQSVVETRQSKATTCAH